MPAGNPTGLAETVRVDGVVPVVGFTDNQPLPDRVLALHETLLLEESVTVAVALAAKVPVLLALRLNVLGLALNVPEENPVTVKITGNCVVALIPLPRKMTVPE